jgi:DNA-binding MurR/RpiR family transcriptional regulator
VNPQTPLQERIYRQRADFSPGYNRLADFLLDSYLAAAMMTAHELAQALDLDPATVVRFCQHLGYSGYPELQRELRARVRSEFSTIPQPDPSQTGFEQFSQALSRMSRQFPAEAMEALLEKFSTADQILILPDAPTDWAARRTTALLAAAGFPVRIADPQPDALVAGLAGLHAGDLLLVIDLLGETPLPRQALEWANRSGVTTALICGAASLPSAGQAGILLPLYTSDDPLLRHAAAGGYFAALLTGLDRRFPERLSAAQAKLHELSVQIESLSPAPSHPQE